MNMPLRRFCIQRRDRAVHRDQHELFHSRRQCARRERSVPERRRRIMNRGCGLSELIGHLRTAEDAVQGSRIECRRSLQSHGYLSLILRTIRGAVPATFPELVVTMNLSSDVRWLEGASMLNLQRKSTSRAATMSEFVILEMA